MTNRDTVRIRRNVADFDDPYIDDESLEENSVCVSCGAVYLSGRWYMKDMVPEAKLSGEVAHETLCPACQKQRDRVPGGMIRIRGQFFWNHKDEIMNLIRNENAKAQAVNPLERIMSFEEVDGEVEITTTNEKLAQRIGRALHKAYRGDIEYKWSEDTKIARVYWHRDE